MKIDLCVNITIATEIGLFSFKYFYFYNGYDKPAFQVEEVALVEAAIPMVISECKTME